MLFQVSAVRRAPLRGLSLDCEPGLYVPFESVLEFRARSSFGRARNAHLAATPTLIP